MRHSHSLLPFGAEVHTGLTQDAQDEHTAAVAQRRVEAGNRQGCKVLVPCEARSQEVEESNWY